MLRFTLWVLVGLLCAFGLVMVTTTTASRGAGAEAVTYSFLIKQSVFLIFGVGAALMLARLVGSDGLRRGWAVACLAALALGGLGLVLACGRTVNGAQRWLQLGPVNLQPSEFAKLAMVVVLAWYFSSRLEKVRSAWHGVLVPVAGFAVVAGLVYLTRDLGSVVVMWVALAAALAFAGANLAYFAALNAMIAPAAIFVAAWEVAYRRDRMLAFLDPLNMDGPTAYHLKQSFIAIGSGGVGGLGLGQGLSKAGFLPEHHTDFIFAVICEETGMLGGLAVAFLFLLLVWTGLAIAARSQDMHRRLLAVGATVVIGFQAFGNMLVATGSVPTKGMTLPFISYGGSSLVVCLLLIGILDAVAAANARQAGTQPLRISQRMGASVKRKTWKLSSSWSDRGREGRAA